MVVLGCIVFLGEIIKFFVFFGFFGGVKVVRVLVKEGDKVKEG